MPVEMKTYEDLKNNESITKDENLKKLLKEINDLKNTDDKDDKIDGVMTENQSKEGITQKSLDEGLKKSLMSFDKSVVDIIVKELVKFRGKEGVDDLLKLLNEIQMEKGQVVREKVGSNAFEKFKLMIEGKNEKGKNKGTNTVNELNRLSGQEMKDIINYIKDDGNKSDVYALYFSMKNINRPSNFKSTDQKNYNDVLFAIEDKYPELKDNLKETEKNFKLNELFKDNHKAKDLVKLAKSYLGNENWNGEMLVYSEALEGNFEGKGFSCQDFINKFNEINTERQNQNDNIVGEVVNNINIPEDEMKNFKVEGGVLKYSGEEFTKERMMIKFNGFIDPKLGEGDFVNDEERSAIVEKIYDKISEKIKNDLGNSDEIPDGKDTSKLAGDEYEMTDEDYDAMRQELGDDKMFIEKGEDDKVTYDLNKVKNYLDSIKDTDWNDLKAKYGTPEGRAWISAVQILLNTQEGVDIKVDGKFGPETIRAVKEFQATHSLKFKNGKEDENGEPDGLPGKVTMTKMLEILGGVSSDGVESEEIVSEVKYNNIQEAVENGQIKSEAIKEENGRKYILIGDKKYFDGNSDNLGNEDYYLQNENGVYFGKLNPSTGEETGGKFINKDGHVVDIHKNEDLDIPSGGGTDTLDKIGDAKLSIDYLDFEAIKNLKYEDLIAKIDSVGFVELGLKKYTAVNELNSFTGEGYIKGEAVDSKGNPDNYLYIGEFSNGKINGKGTIIHENGDKYTGSWENELFVGTGTYFWNDGDSYVGNWENDKRNGQGTYYFKNGNRFVGGFKDDNYESGKFITGDGEEYQVERTKYGNDWAVGLIFQIVGGDKDGKKIDSNGNIQS